MFLVYIKKRPWKTKASLINILLRGYYDVPVVVEASADGAGVPVVIIP
jgi:hypothetical protein